MAGEKMSFADKLKAALTVDGNVATYDLLYAYAAQIEAVVRAVEESLNYGTITNTKAPREAFAALNKDSNV